MVFGVCAALLSAVCYGVAAVLQARAVRTTGGTPGGDAAPLARLVIRAPFLAGLLLDLVGFGAQLAALRWLPVFVVQAAQASNLAVTAVAAIPLLGARLDRRKWLAVALVCVGLGGLAATAGPQHAGPVGIGVHLLFLGLAVVLAVAGLLAGRLTGPARSPVLGVVAGLGFGVVALAARALTSLAPTDLVRDPASYALAAAGATGFLFYTRALQGGSVTATVAAVILGETIFPAIVGVVLLGDHTRAGLVPVAALGFTLAIAGALELGRSAPSPHAAAG